MNAADVMNPNPITISSDTKLAEVVQLMLERHVGGLPVVSPDGKLLGIVTERDLLRRAEAGTEKHRPRWLELLVGPGRLATEYLHPQNRRVDEIMTSKVATVTPNTPLAEVVNLMERRHISRVPVVDGEVCIGIVSRADLLRALRLVLQTRSGRAP